VINAAEEIILETINMLKGVKRAVYATDPTIRKPGNKAIDAK